MFEQIHAACNRMVVRRRVALTPKTVVLIADRKVLNPDRAVMSVNDVGGYIDGSRSHRVKVGGMYVQLAGLASWRSATSASGSEESRWPREAMFSMVRRLSLLRGCVNR